MHQNPLTIFTLAEHIYREGATSAQVSQVYIHKYPTQDMYNTS